MKTIENIWLPIVANKHAITKARIRWDTDSDPDNEGWVLDTKGNEGCQTDAASPDTYHLERSPKGAMAALRGSLWYHYGIKIVRVQP